MSWPTRLSFSAAESDGLRAAAASWTVAALADRRAQLTALDTACERMPRLREVVDRLTTAVHRTGAVIAQGTPLDDSVLIMLAGALGEVTPVGNGSPPGRLVYDLVTGPDSPYDPEALPLHTDSVFEARPHPHMGLACVRPSPGGDGLTTLARADRLAEAVAERDPHHLRLLQDPCFPFAKLRGGRADPDTAVRRSPVLRVEGDDVTVTFHGRHVREGMQLRPAAVDAEHRAALRTLEAVLAEPGFSTVVALDRGDLLLTDNQRVLHGRTEVLPAAGERHVKRIKIWSD
ncbi:TauD/TfdA family dioxygenase [Kitasatospora sp. NBC_01266]|uniref:TauD/TfdA family dioxygenase n=1 Tax=Kitasatospora sp. NBC_01266 TaxID=2903572 RepID=UPI002E347726|nr:TauD/TfdA family dioxygenase [Kitasatospora sp. NBC_01266]